MYRDAAWAFFLSGVSSLVVLYMTLSLIVFVTVPLFVERHWPPSFTPEASGLLQSSVLGCVSLVGGSVDVHARC